LNVVSLFLINLNKEIMKTPLLVLIIWITGIYGIFAQDNTINRSPISSGYAPAFKAVSTQGDISFPEDYYGKWKILFSHPADFTPVCTSEIIALAKAQEDFKKLNTALIVISTDGLNSHIEWVRSIESISIDGESPVKIDFPIVSDADHTISNAYGILQESNGKLMDRRTVYIMNEDNKIKAMFYYPNEVGRNIEELKRTLIALQTTERHEVMTPANWEIGEDVLLPSPATPEESAKMAEKQTDKMYQLAWYMWFKKL
jgi:peroxiredoxin (alkyl hydroperoxide reductase subunit C)